MDKEAFFRRQRLTFKFAFAMATLLYMGVVHVMTFKGNANDVQTFSKILAAVYVVILLVSPVLERMQSQALPALMIRLACRETGAIFGLVLSMISHDPNYAVYFGVPALLLILIA